MPFIFKRLALLTSIAAALLPFKAPAADKDEAKFVPGPAAGYQSHQTSEGVTIGAAAYVSDEEAKPAFGKHNPYNSGVMPVLVVIQNDSGKSIRLDSMQVILNGPNGNKIEATPARDVRFLKGPERPPVRPTPMPVPIPKMGGHKNLLDNPQIEARAFAAKMLPSGQSASGFFYFQSGYQRGSTIYLSGLTEAQSGKGLLYFEMPLTEK